MGYAQGMNDLLARFLVVTDSEVDAFWMFERYMKDKRIDFMEASMMRKVGESIPVPCVLPCVSNRTSTFSGAHAFNSNTLLICSECVCVYVCTYVCKYACVMWAVLCASEHVLKFLHMQCMYVYCC